MDIYPAIDIERGRVQRIAAAEWEDPLALARTYVAGGASWVHVVDMDRALGTGGENDRLVRRLCGLPDVRVQVGGNITDPAWALDMVSAGAARVVLGSAAAVEPGLLERLVSDVGTDRAAVALDVREGAPASRDSAEPLPITLDRLTALLRDAGVHTMLYRDLARDGTLGGAELEGAARFSEHGFAVIAAGGVASIDELKAASRLGLHGVIVGRALLEGRFTLREALACCG